LYLSLGPHYSVATRFFDIFQLPIYSLLLSLMAANLVPSFADLLAADSDFVMPTTDAEVKDALDSFGASFKKTRGDANVAARADLLAGLALLHTAIWAHCSQLCRRLSSKPWLTPSNSTSRRSAPTLPGQRCYPVA
jgi:hypothetical protein